MAYTGAIYSGTPSYQPAQFGNGLNAAVIQQPSIPAQTVGTLELWVKTTSAKVLVAYGSGQSSPSGLWLGMNATGYAVVQPPGGTQQASTIIVNDGAFHHLAVTVDGTNLKLWVDGALGATTPYTSALTFGASTGIGGFAGAGLSQYDWTASNNGIVDEIRISSTVRYSATFTRPAAAFTDDANTVALYHLDSDYADSHSATATAPSAPTGLNTSPGSGQVALSWTAGAANGAAITDYTVQYSSDSGSTWTSFAHTASATTSQTVTGLTNGTAYLFRVAGVNSVGTGPYSATASATPTAASATIAATDAGIFYSPGNWGLSGANMKTINAGAYLKARVTASGATAFQFALATANDLTPLPQVETRIDGGAWTAGEVAATVQVAIPATNVWASHLLELRVKSMTETQARWSTTATEVVVTGITAVGASTASTVAVQTRTLRTIVFGDSITEGVRTLGGTGYSKDTDRNSAAHGWAYHLGELLGTEVGVVGFGATGVTVAGSGGVPAIGTSFSSLWGSGPARSFAGVDIIIVNEGTNDGGASSATFTTAYTNFLNALIALVPVTTTIVAMRPFNGTHATDVQAAIAACTAPNRVTYLDTTGFFTSSDSFDNLHPYGIANLTAIGPQVAAKIRALRQRGTIFRNVGGTPMPTSPTRA